MQHGVRSGANPLTDIPEGKKHEGSRTVPVNSAAESESFLSSADNSAPKRQSMDPLEVQDLPELPPFPPRPTLHISFEDVVAYIKPLVSHQWKVSHVCAGVAEDEILSLDRRYRFKGFNDVMDFVQGVADISRAEKHHARIVIEYSTVDISLHTHSACTFHRTEEGKPESKKVPGLTQRDIRFALKVEELHKTFREQGRAMQFVPAALPHVQRRSMKIVLRRYGQTQTVVELEGVCSTSSSNMMEIWGETSSNTELGKREDSRVLKG
jgi:pterin-4a-carbinolamine dehydratase